MDEPINKKNILILFAFLVLIFLFIYKGVILTGEEYAEAYNHFRDVAIQKQNQSTLKKGKEKDQNGSTVANNLNNSNMYKVLQDYEDILLSFNSALHTIKTKDYKLEDYVEIFLNKTNNNSIDLNITTELNEFLQGYKNERIIDQNTLNNIYEKLTENIAALRNTTTRK